MTVDISEFRLWWWNQTPEQKESYLKTLSPDEIAFFWDNPSLFLFPKQYIPEGDWRYFILRCGRRFGKSISGSAWIAEKIIKGAKEVGLCGATYEDVAKIMVPSIIRWFQDTPETKPVFNSQQHLLKFPSGAICHTYTSDKETRGHSLEALWCDEVGSWADSIPEKVEERFNILDTCVSTGKNPQTIITSTPKPHPIFIKWQEQVDKHNPSIKMMTGTMFDNPWLSDKYRKAEIAKYGSTRLGRQEIYGHLLTETEGALWSQKLIDDTRIETHHYNENIIWNIVRTVIAVDPAGSTGTNSDLTGISVVSMDKNYNTYVLADLSGVYSPLEWAKKVNEAQKEYQADCIVAEKNYGGNLVEANLRGYNPNVRIKMVQAKKNKISRADPVAAQFEQNKAHIVGSLPELEKQMVHFTAKEKGHDDRLDAMVYSITELVLDKTYVCRDLSNFY